MRSVPNNVSALLAEFNLTEEAVRRVLTALGSSWDQLPPLPGSPANRGLPQAVRDRFAELRWGITRMAQQHGLEIKYVYKIVSRSLYATEFALEGKSLRSARLYSGLCYAHVLTATTRLRLAPPLEPNWMWLSEAVKEIGISRNAYDSFRRNHSSLGLHEPSFRASSTGPHMAIPRTTFEKLRDWLPDAPPAGWHTVSELSRSTGWSIDTVLAYAEEHRLPSHLHRNQSGVVLSYFESAGFTNLGTRPQVELGGTWHTFVDLQKALGVTRRWVETYLNRSTGQDRETPRGVIYVHYPPEELRRLQEFQASYQPAGSWLNINQLSTRLGRSAAWVKENVDRAVGELRWSATSGKLLTHYPPTEFNRLRDMAHQEPVSGMWLTVHSLALLLGRSERWVLKRLDPALAEDRVGAGNRVHPHYPMSELTRLRNLPPDAPAAGNWLTVSAIARELRRSAVWVNARINRSVAERRTGTDGRTYPHYPPSELERLRELSNQS